MPETPSTSLSSRPSPEETLARNLGALAAVNHELAERLTWPVDSEHVDVDAAGHVRYRIHQTWYPLESEDSVLERVVEDALREVEGVGARRALLLGVGSGSLLERLLRVEPLREIRAWERDPWLLRLALSRVDVAREISSRRLRPLLTTDLIGERTVGCALVRHPLLGERYRRELLHLDGPPPNGRVALAAGQLFVDQLGDELGRRGLAPWTIDLTLLSKEEVARSVRTLAPRLLVAVNYTVGLAELAHEHDLPVVVWEVDPASAPPRGEGVPTPNVRLFTHAPSGVDAWRAAGFESVRYLPLAADPSVRSGAPRQAKALRHSVTFVGQSLVENARILARRFSQAFISWRGGGPEHAREAQRVLSTLLTAQRATYDEFVLPAVLDDCAAGFRAAALDMLNPEDPVVLAGEAASSEHRLASLKALGALEPEVWGDEGWRRAEQYGALYRGPAGHGPELTAIYDQSTVNLDVGRLYQSDIVTMRVFDALSCGGLVLTRRNAALEALFDADLDIATYRSLDELVAKARYYCERPQEALDLAARGREVVLARHTIAHRMDELLEGLVD